MRTLVTGGAGFIGSNLVDALVSRGDDVLVLDDLSSGKRSNLASAQAAGASIVEGNIADRDTVREVFAVHRPEQVFHLAAQIDVRVSVSDPAFDLGVNAGGTINLLDSAVETNSERFLFASTGGAIYGEGDGRQLPLGEDAERFPGAPYGLSKMAAESYIDLYRRLHGLKGLALRLGNVYGPRQDPHGEAGVVAIFCGAMLEGRTPTVFGDGSQTRDYVYVGDVVDAFVTASGSEVTGALNIGTGRESTVMELGNAIASAYGQDFDPQMAPPRAGEVSRIAISPTRATSELGWTARTDLDAGLGLTADWARRDASA